MSENRGPWLSTAMTLFLTWTLLTFLVRVWAKLRTKNWGLDDYGISAALIIAWIHHAMLYRAIQLGYGKPSSEISPANITSIGIFMYASSILYVTSLGLCRIAAAIFVAHMSHSGPQNMPGYVLAALSLTWIGVSALVVAIRSPLSHPWTTLEGSEQLYPRWIAIEAVGLVIEVALWVLSVSLIWGLQMKTQKRLFILIAFAVRLCLIPIITLRLVYLSPGKNNDPTITTIIPNILTAAVLQFSVMASSVTSLKPFLRTFNQPAYSYPTSGTQTSGRSNARLSYYKLDTFKRVDRSAGVSNDSANWRPFQGSVEGTATAQPQRAYLPQGENDRAAEKLSRSASKHAYRNSKKFGGDDGDLAEDATERIIIQKTTELSIQYEELPPRS